MEKIDKLAVISFIYCPIFIAGHFSNCIIKVAENDSTKSVSIFVTNSGAFAIPGKR